MVQSGYLQAYNSKDEHIGTFDGEYLYDHTGNMLLRVDEDEVYDLGISCQRIGIFSDDSICDPDGKKLFSFSE